MDTLDDLVERIIARGSIVNAARRHEIARELRSHLHDVADEARLSGHDESAVRTIVVRRFGDADDIAAQFAQTYRTERTTRHAWVFLGLMVTSVATVALVVAGVQLLIAVQFGDAIRIAFRGMPWETLGFVALAWGYVGLYGTEYLLRRARMRTVLLVHVCTFAAAAACVASLAHGHMSTPAVAFVGATMVRLAQRRNVPLAAFAGTAGPLLIAWVVLGPLVSGLGRLTSWETCGALWIGMSLSCRALTALVRVCDRRLLTAAP
jgi:hypothetical protein